ncbi:DUF3732 domain-containing protein [Paenibacillus sp. YN15]|uniref:DUF3732 domain-containing protein n=1 Tax=Paenibacillus sp. YN15 TaxID=1742774 RepID=UPI000DCD040F|nr:DUF3732 domain-containing protein [Paenibacillus sp. YN15]RAU91040.1 hypothetical protein DQG13_29970 [Paenibacillus sp. YN15]
MKRWNIRKIVIYSHNGEKNELTFDLEKVNIITGESRTGKSAIPEIIDYVMGSGECHIPAYVRRTLSWAGLVWQKNENQFAVFRKVPRAGANSSSESHYVLGTNVNIPKRAEEIPSHTNIDTSMRKFESLLGMGEVKTETFGSIRDSKSITIRTVLPYMLQDDNIITNKSILLRGTDEYQKRQHIIDSLPYYLGIIDEETMQKEIQMRDLTRQIRRLEKQKSEDDSIAGVGTSKAYALLYNSYDLGLCESPPPNLTEETIQQLLFDVSQWKPYSPSQQEGRLSNLYEKLTGLQSEAVIIRRKINYAKKSIESASEFETTANTQGKRLEVINIYKKPHEVSSCPLCQRELSTENNAVKSINDMVKKVQHDLSSVRKERPKLDKYLNHLQETLYSMNEQITQTEFEISQLIKEDDTLEAGLDLQDRRNRLVGSIDLYLGSVAKVAERGGTRIGSNIVTLKEMVKKLEEELDADYKKEALANIELRIATTAREIIKEIPFEEKYREEPIYLNLRDMKVGIALRNRIEFMRDVGSDENYLSLHVSVLLAFHRHFAQQNRPVPGVLLFDQISRPYFPPDEEPNLVEISENSDRSSLMQYFNLLFKETRRGESLQVIVLEHADFKNSSEYQNAVKKRWKKGIDGLIPIGWPEKD